MCHKYWINLTRACSLHSGTCPTPTSTSWDYRKPESFNIQGDKGFFFIGFRVLIKAPVGTTPETGVFMSVSIGVCRQILVKTAEKMSNEEIEGLRDSFVVLSDLAIDSYLAKRKSKLNEEVYENGISKH